MYCCPNCFSDKFLQEHISADSNKKGKCSFCKTENMALIKPEELSSLFEPLLDLYEEDGSGRPINKLIQTEWNIFEISDEETQKSLIREISGNKKTFLKYTSIYQQERTDNVQKWEKFREELMHKNRFFPNKEFSRKNIEVITQYIGFRIEKGHQKLYRARINKEGKSFDLSKMGKPPEEKVSNGRANPIGISYLYLASDKPTAISEVRGSKGESVTVAEFKIISDLEIIDLRNPLGRISPFGLNEDDDLKLIYKNIPFLISFGTELSKPIIPRRANLEYLPSQYLCELFKSMGFHGIIHKSSIADGDNYVVFEDKGKLEAVQCWQYEITDIKTEFKLMKRQK